MNEILAEEEPDPAARLDTLLDDAEQDLADYAEREAEFPEHHEVGRIRAGRLVRWPHRAKLRAFPGGVKPLMCSNHKKASDSRALTTSERRGTQPTLVGKTNHPNPPRGGNEPNMSSYLSVLLIFLLTLSPVLIPAGISTAHAINRGRKRSTAPAA